MKDQLGLMERMRLAAREEREAQCTRYSGAVYDFVTIAQADDVTRLLNEGWEDLTPLLKAFSGKGCILGHRLGSSHGIT